ETLPHGGEDLLERSYIRSRSLVEGVPERDLAILGDDQRKAQLAQVMAAILTMASLGQLAPLVGRVDVCKEIGRVVGKKPGRQLLRLHDLLDDPFLGDRSGGDGHGVHLVPKMLAREICSLHRESLGQARGLRPLRNSPLAGGMAEPCNAGQGQAFADGQAVAFPRLAFFFLDRSIDDSGNIELGGQAIERIHGTRGDGLHSQALLGVLQLREEVVRLSQVHEGPDGGAPVFAAIGLDDSPVGVSVAGEALERGHSFAYTISKHCHNANRNCVYAKSFEVYFAYTTFAHKTGANTGAREKDGPNLGKSR